MRRAVLIALFTTLCACSAGTDSNGDGVADGVYKPNDVTLVAPSTPLGTVSGLVLDASSAPLVGATVKASLPDGLQTATTDASGNFGFKNVPGGSTVGVTISLAGYTTGYAQTVVPSSAGNVPLNNADGFIGPVRLFATTGKIAVTVIGYDGQEVAATGTLQVSPAYLVSTQAYNANDYGWTVSHATSSAGVLTFADVPSLSALALWNGDLTLTVDPVVGTDGHFLYGGAFFQVSAAAALASPSSLSVTLPPPGQQSGTLKIAGASCASLTGASGVAGSLIQGSDKVHVVFNQRVRPDSISVQLDGDDGKPIASAITPGTSGSAFDFTTSTGTFATGHAVAITIRAIAVDAQPQVQKTFTGTCFVAPAGGTNPVITKATYIGPPGTPLSAGAQVSLELDSQVGVESGTAALAVYIDADLDGDGEPQGLGENDSLGRNTAGGFRATIDPSKPSFGGFSRYFVFTYQQVNTVPANTGIHLSFSDAHTPGVGASEWITGASLVGSLPVTGSLTPIVPAP